MGVIGYAETSSYPAVDDHTEHRVLSLPPDGRPTVPPPPNSTLGSSVPHSPPRSELKRPVERPSSSDTGHSAQLATKGSVQQSLVNRPVYSEHVPVTPGPGKTRYRSNDQPHQVYRLHRPHRVHQSHRVHRSHRVHWSDQSTLVRKLKRKRPTSAWTRLSFLFLFHRSDWCI